MYPVLFSIGHVHLYSQSVFFVLSWLVFSFLFWKVLRSEGVDEDKIFDLMFYATLIGFVASRLGFVLFHWDLFRETLLKIVAVWVQSGLTVYGAIAGAILTLIFLSRREKVRLGAVLDAFALSFPAAFFVGLIGGFLDGSVIGKITKIPWAIRYVGSVGLRHPVQLYELIACLILIILLSFLEKRSNKGKWPYGIIGVWFFLLFSAFMFPLEFFKESRVYWSLSANQWILIALFAEALGAFYVRCGGREAIRPFINKIYAKFSKRRS
jgi:phosphatidylglycerol---prolipoprotein diacylglyceryl transferase